MSGERDGGATHCLRVRVGQMSSLITGLSVSALMHLAISMFLLVATGSAAPTPCLTCQYVYQSQHAMARGLHISKGGAVRAVSASESMFLSLVKFIAVG